MEASGEAGRRDVEATEAGEAIAGQEEAAGGVAERGT